MILKIYSLYYSYLTILFMYIAMHILFYLFLTYTQGTYCYIMYITHLTDWQCMDNLLDLEN